MSKLPTLNKQNLALQRLQKKLNTTMTIYKKSITNKIRTYKPILTPCINTHSKRFIRANRTTNSKDQRAKLPAPSAGGASAPV